MGPVRVADSLAKSEKPLILSAGVEAVTLSRRFKMFVRGGGQNRLIEPAKLITALLSPTTAARR
jgi:hypothetical protein